MKQFQFLQGRRPLAFALAMVFTTAFWLPTVSSPAEAAATATATAASSSAAGSAPSGMTSTVFVVVAVAPTLM